MEPIEPVRKILQHRNRKDLAALLNHASIDFDISSNYGSYSHSQLTTAEIYAPIINYDRLNSLSEEDKHAILEAILEIWPPRDDNMEIATIVFRLDPSSLDENLNNNTELLQEIDRLKSTMIAVSTGGPKIDSVNQEYKTTYDRVDSALSELNINNPIPYRDLWDWYGKWSSGDLPTYKSRREYITDLFAPLEQRLRKGVTGRGAEIFPEPTGWALVDRQLGEARKRLEEASTEEQFQTVGTLCREAIISLAQIVYDPEKHPTIDGVTPSETDAKRLLDAYISTELSGGSHKYVRKHAKASLDVANALQHKRTAAFRDAALCAEATASIINMIAIISGKRDPEK